MIKLSSKNVFVIPPWLPVHIRSKVLAKNVKANIAVANALTTSAVVNVGLPTELYLALGMVKPLILLANLVVLIPVHQVQYPLIVAATKIRFK